MKLGFSVQEQMKRLSKKEHIRHVKCTPNENKISYIKNSFESTWIVVKFLSTEQDQIVYSSSSDIKDYTWLDESVLIIEQDIYNNEELIILNVQSLEEYKIKKVDKDEFLKEYFEKI